MENFDLVKSVQEIFKSPSSIAALIGMVLILIFLIAVKKVKLNTKILVQIAIALALATVLKIFRVYHLPQGGSITLGSMIPILLIAMFYGPEVGFLTGFLYGIITLIMDPYILHPIQVLFDYPLPFMMLGLVGYFKDRKIIGTIIAIFGRFVCHFISGVVFFGSFAPEGMSPYIYSLLVNGIFLGIEGFICVLIIYLLPIKRLYEIVKN